MWPSKIQAKLSGFLDKESQLANHICSSSKFILVTQTAIRHKKNDKFDSFSFPGIQHDRDFYEV